MLPPVILEAIDALPMELLSRSGSVFYSGRSAFSRPTSLYILGLNPGGSPSLQADETIEFDLAEWKGNPRKNWSSYLDDSWRGRKEGTYGIQPRLAHMFRQLKLDLREVPAANVVFVRSATEAALHQEKAALLRSCWPVHDAVITTLGIRAVLALGGTAGRWVRERLQAHTPVGSFVEANARGWTSEAHQAGDGRIVITVTHPGRADWRNPAADPTPLVKRTLDFISVE